MLTSGYAFVILLFGVNCTDGNRLLEHRLHDELTKEEADLLSQGVKLEEPPFDYTLDRWPPYRIVVVSKQLRTILKKKPFASGKALIRHMKESSRSEFLNASLYATALSQLLDGKPKYLFLDESLWNAIFLWGEDIDAQDDDGKTIREREIGCFEKELKRWYLICPPERLMYQFR